MRAKGARESRDNVDRNESQERLGKHGPKCQRVSTSRRRSYSRREHTTGRNQPPPLLFASKMPISDRIKALQEAAKKSAEEESPPPKSGRGKPRVSWHPKSLHCGWPPPPARLYARRNLRGGFRHVRLYQLCSARLIGSNVAGAFAS